MLTLAEGLVLLALDDEKGTVGWRSDAALDLGLAGALLADLALRERIGITGRTVTTRSTAPVGDALLDEALALVTSSTTARDARGWVKEVHQQVKHLRERVCAGLVAQGILRREEHTTLFVVRRHRYPSGNPAPEQALRADLHVAAQALPPIAPWLVALLSVAQACDLLAGVVAKDARQQVAALVKDEPWGEAVRHAIRARRAVLAAAGSSGFVAVQH